MSADARRAHAEILEQLATGVRAPSFFYAEELEALAAGAAALREGDTPQEREEKTLTRSDQPQPAVEALTNATDIETV